MQILTPIGLIIIFIEIRMKRLYKSYKANKRLKKGGEPAREGRIVVGTKRILFNLYIHLVLFWISLSRFGPGVWYIHHNFRSERRHGVFVICLIPRHEWTTKARTLPGASCSGDVMRFNIALWVEGILIIRYILAIMSLNQR